MRKKLLIVVIMLLLCCLFASCTKGAKTTQSHTKESIQPYELTKSDSDLLQTLNLQDKANIFTFKAPKATRNLEVSTYVLNKECKWEENGHGKVSIDDTNRNMLEGTFSMLLSDHYSIEFNIDTMGKASYKSDEIVLDQQKLASSKVYLSQNKRIRLGKQIPVAIMVYDSGNSMKTYSVDDYFHPQKFQGMDLVQAVVLRFSDNEK
ncbi:hypothetical protein [Anaeromicropila herbilytica]|uniref:Lipoprotein n=1 Tax=Anaeromicropila herbilytica TaxID=2785025 RepID=A0A7R7EH19_9FIRM|nr:hypothetical protein [Anaeromicropila herbilytica]BCN29080.1 hypothetical protein bsdtb5_03750 [Anaeromicropila herbilytica]